MIFAKGINDAWIKLLSKLKSEGEKVSPRGFESIELKNVSVKIKNPKIRILDIPIRKTSLPFAFGELMWYLSGRNDVAMMEYYSKNMIKFSDDGETLNSAYGYRIFGLHDMIPFNQWKYAVEKLKEDPCSRQAIIHLHTPDNKPTKDQVCTLSLQLMIRDNKLDMYVNMRSNDVVLGFTYDVFAFTSMQELMANELGIEVGEYFHNAASMHIYEKDYHLMDTALNPSLFENLLSMSRMSKEFSFEGLTINDPRLKQLMGEEVYYRMYEDCIEDKEQVNVGKVSLPKIEAIEVMKDVFHKFHVYKRKGFRAMFELCDYNNIHHLQLLNQLSGKNLRESKLVIVEGSDGVGKTTFVNRNYYDEYTRIWYMKPEKDFDKHIFYYTSLMSGDIILDRYFYSDFAYGQGIFKGTENEAELLTTYDAVAIEKLLNFRDAKLIIIDGDTDICYSRLNDEDKEFFSKEQIHNLLENYRVLHKNSTVIHKYLLETQQGEL